jgi:hypothetical protein
MKNKNSKKSFIKFFHNTENLLINQVLNSTLIQKIEKEKFYNFYSRKNFPDKNFTLNTNDKSYEIAHGPCSAETNCFLPYGVCLNETACLCLPDYANIYIKEESLQQIRCSYKKKKLIIAGLLELFLPLSLGHFYVLQVNFGLIKLIYNVLVYSLCCVLFVKSNEVKQSSIFICLMLSCLIPVWNFTDMFLFFTGYYKDGYGVALN